MFCFFSDITNILPHDIFLCCRAVKATDRRKVTLLIWKPSPAFRIQTHPRCQNLILSDRYVETTRYASCSINVDINQLKYCHIFAKTVSGLYQHLTTARSFNYYFSLPSLRTFCLCYSWYFERFFLSYFIFVWFCFDLIFLSVTSSVTCFKAIAGAEADSAAGDILDALGDDRLSDIDMEPLDTSDLVSENKRWLSIVSSSDPTNIRVQVPNKTK